jgi:hypothetical protein
MKRCLLVLGTVIAAASALHGCGTQTGNGFVSVELGAYSGFAWYWPIKPAYAAVSSVTFCFKRIRFKTENEATASNPALDPDNLDFTTGEITISPSGTVLRKIPVPPGIYRRIEFDLEANCGSGGSVSVSNTSGDGNHVTDERVTVKFQGTFVMGTEDSRVSLEIQNVVSALDTVTGDGEIRSRLETVSGTY